MQPVLLKQPKSPPQSNIGNIGESLACSFLRKKSYTILARNYRGGKGEIDIVASHRGIVVFVEVKTRTTDRYGSPKDAVTPKKIAEIVRAGQYYCMEHHDAPKSLRIDVMAITIDPKTHCLVSLEHIPCVT